MTSQTLRFNFCHLLEQWLPGRKGGEKENTKKLNILKTKKNFLDQIKHILHNFKGNHLVKNKNSAHKL